MDIKFANIFDYLDRVRERPSMYFRSRSLYEIETFCHGYYAALGVHEIREMSVPKLDNWHFGRWVNRHFGRSNSCGWARQIRDSCKSDEEAFEKFFELFDMYRVLRPVRYAEICLGQSHKPTGHGYILGNGAWMLPPERLAIFRYEPEDFYFWVEYYPHTTHDRDTFGSLDEVFARAERMWGILPDYWTKTDKMKFSSSEPRSISSNQHIDSH